MKRLGLLLLILGIILPGTIAAAETTALAKEVMSIHDDAMLHMTEMHELRLQLIEIEKTTGSTEQTRSLITGLKDAHKGMMQWMREYTHPQSIAEAREKEDYLLEEKKKISRVAEDIDRSLSMSREFIANHSNKE